MSKFWFIFPPSEVDDSVHDAAACAVMLLVHAGAQIATDSVPTPVALVDAFRHVEVALVSDAIEQLLHQKVYVA